MTTTNTPCRGRLARFTLSPCHLVALSFLAVGCDLPGKPKEDHRPQFPNQVADFDRLFNQNCRGCHGPEGKTGPAPPLNDDLFRAGISAQEIKEVLTVGRPRHSMPAFLAANGGSLTPAQIEILVHEIKGTPYTTKLKGHGQRAKLEVSADRNGKAPRWNKPAPLPASAPPYKAPAGEKGERERGIQVYARACAECHGSHGQGGGGQGDRNGHKVGAINNRDFLTLTSDQALRRLIITGRPDLGMPHYAGKRSDPAFKPLTSQDVADLVALLVYWRQSGVVSRQ